MKAKHIVTELFRKRPDASIVGYIPAIVILAFFALLAAEDGSYLGMLPYALLLVVGLAQLRLRTLAGWLLLLAVFAGYALLVAFTPEKSSSNYGEYAFFVACGSVPAIFLLIFRPRLFPKSNSQRPRAEGAK